MKKVTIKDIAKALNKSVGTISKALSDSYEVSEQTKKMVREYAAIHDFRPSRLAKSLRSGKSKMIGMVITYIGNSFASQLLEGIEKELSNTDYSLLIMQSKEDVEIERHCIDTLRNQGVDGLIISPIGDSPNIAFLQELLDNRFPVIIVDRINNELSAPKIGVNNQQGAYEAINHLISKGRNRILHLTSNTLGVTSERLNGHIECLKKYAIPFNPDYIISVDLGNLEKSFEIIEQKLNFFFIQPQKPTAIFSAVDQLTNMIVRILRKLDPKISHELGLAGFSNLIYTDSFALPISCVVQPAEEMGRLAVKQILKLINGDEKVLFYKVELPTHLVTRDAVVCDSSI